MKNVFLEKFRKVINMEGPQLRQLLQYLQTEAADHSNTESFLQITRSFKLMLIKLAESKCLEENPSSASTHPG